MDRVTVYVDGFNFYYGLKRTMVKDRDWKKFYWIDFVKLFEHFTPKQQLLKVVYFTTPPLNILKRQRQYMLLRANRLLNGNRFEAVKGRFIEKENLCPVCKSTYFTPEEKRTDVNISVRMMEDCVHNHTDMLILVTADSDLIPTIKSIKKFHPDKKVRVFFPPENFSNDINNFLKSNREKVVELANNKGKFIASVMPDTVTVNGKSSAIPPEWKV